MEDLSPEILEIIKRVDERSSPATAGPGASVKPSVVPPEIGRMVADVDARAAPEGAVPPDYRLSDVDKARLQAERAHNPGTIQDFLGDRWREVGDSARLFAHGFSWGLQEPVEGAVMGTTNQGADVPTEVNNARRRLEEARYRSGYLAPVLEIGGGIVSGNELYKLGLSATGQATRLASPAVEALRQGGGRLANWGGNALRFGAAGAGGALDGAFAAGVYAAATGEDYESIAGSAAAGAGLGAAGGLAAELITDGINAFRQRYATQQARSAMADAAQSARSLKDDGQSIFREVENMGVYLEPSAANRLFTAMEHAVTSRARTQNLQGRVASLIGEAREVLVNSGNRNVSLPRVENLRQLASSLAGSMDPTERMLAMGARNMIDEFLANLDEASFHLDPAAVVHRGVTKDQALQGFRDARDLWRRGVKATVIEAAFENAARTSPQDLGRAAKQEVKKLLRLRPDGRAVYNWTPDERRALLEISQGEVRSGTLKLLNSIGIGNDGANNFLARFFARTVAGTGGGAAGLAVSGGHPVGGIVGSGAGFGAFSAASHRADQMAGQQATDAVEYVRNMVATGGRAPASNFTPTTIPGPLAATNQSVVRDQAVRPEERPRMSHILMGR